MKGDSRIRVSTFFIPVAALFMNTLAQLSAAHVVAFTFRENFPVSSVADTLQAHMGTLAVLQCVFFFLFFGLAFFFAKNYFRRSFFMEKPSGFAWFSFPVIAFAVIGISQIYLVFVEGLAKWIPSISESMTEYDSKMELSVQGWEWILYGIGVCIFVPVVEEIVFRGLIMGEFFQTMPPPVGILLSAVIFGVSHIQLIQIGYAFIGGLVLACAYYFSGSILIPCLIHMQYNFFGGFLPVILPAQSAAWDILMHAYLLCIPLSICCLIYMAVNKKQRHVREETTL